ncbi:DUF4402 domain-containing protein [Lacisediminimonas profundi]|uniref:DUF4402 domain-containing protein n=1 Tax=Lacisediminimonas profundi TaxID=2603856 RepID=UPI00124B8C10|nr:DUF4402 domain-containing protein [Lacisediminimonas profundi]
MSGRTKPLRAALLGILLGIGLIPNVSTAATSALTFVRDIDFGTFTVLGSCMNCTITIAADPTGTRSASAGVILNPTNPGTSGQYDVLMTGGAPFTYTATVTPATVNMVTAGGTMTVQTFTTSQTTVVKKANTLYVGATLRIPSVGVTAGTFTSGTYTVTTSP